MEKKKNINRGIYKRKKRLKFTNHSKIVQNHWHLIFLSIYLKPKAFYIVPEATPEFPFHFPILVWGTRTQLKLSSAQGISLASVIQKILSSKKNIPILNLFFTLLSYVKTNSVCVLLRQGVNFIVVLK
jgi:hypothetical protein